jgi:glycerol-3-phosphate acyltransferase PlsY
MFVGHPPIASLFASLIGGYALGAVSFGVITTHLGGVGDIREVGSGNIGATNVLRTGRRDLAAITLIGDGAKGAVAVLIAGVLLNPLAGMLAGFGAFIGHLFPFWLGFRGGKGVATYIGILLAIAWPVGLATAATWIAVALLFRISSLAALVACGLSPVYFTLLRPSRAPEAWLLAAMVVLIVIRHRENIRRLLAGGEPRIGTRKSTSGA